MNVIASASGNLSHGCGRCGVSCGNRSAVSKGTGAAGDSFEVCLVRVYMALHSDLWPVGKILLKDDL
ncbi:hypothetical protein E2C01_010298 [Portunus trituberculatus]|uniref:Uncharacterized protein n=1 Tax=Portunus trituberculatus TaxID=210409 RepID=A0A5B7D7Z5_PORTR|nr:hypothetical protein [Portunus trituberculatus]